MKWQEIIGKYQVPLFVEIFENDYLSDINNEYYKYLLRKNFTKRMHLSKEFGQLKQTIL